MLKKLSRLYKNIPSSKKEYLLRIMEDFNIHRISECQNAVLFGSSTLGIKILHILRVRGIKVLAFADNDRQKWGTYIEGIPVISPAEISYRPYSFVIIASKYVKIIHKQLSDLKIKNILPHYVLSVIFPRILPNVFYQGAYIFIVKNRKKIERVYQMLSDEKSRKIFLHIIEFLIFLSSEQLLSVENNQYFLGEFLLSDNETYVDVGAFDSDTFRKFVLRKGISFCKYIALEPDKENFHKLASGIPERYKNKIIALQATASSKNGYVYISNFGREGTCVLKNGDNRVKAITIDKLCKNQRVTSIKIDVEGYDPWVLSGSKTILKQQKPKLAVCVYHRPQHLWELSLLIKRLNSDYSRFFSQAL